MSIEPGLAPGHREAGANDEVGATTAGPMVVVTGAASALGRRVCAALGSDSGPQMVVPLDRRALPGVGGGEVDLLVDDLKARFQGAHVVVHLASAFGPALDGDPEVERADDVEMARRVLEAAASASVRHLVLLSSATVYGAWVNNPVPLTEDAPLRPDPRFAFAVQKAEVERLAGEWRETHPGSTVSLLRAATPVAVDHPGWLARALRAAGALRGPDDDAPAQFLHLDDLAAAVVLAVRSSLDGAANVAPDGWLTPTEFRDLAGPASRLRVPRWIGDRVAALRWRLRLAPAPPGVQPYAAGPWVVANDRLRSVGWRPTQLSEEAYVEATPAGPWATLSPSRRQEIALGISGVLLVGALAGGVALIRRSRLGSSRTTAR
ncbi:MAG: NAD-dependent epimerase/dehydratase family protein [Acidimicrobiales bacterium]